MMRRTAFLFAILSLLPALSTPTVAATNDPIDGVRELYLEATERESGIQHGLDAVASLRSESALDARDGALLDAYEGALVTLKAKYVFWPTTRMRHLNEGLGVLDSLVAAHSDDSEIRYLRLMSCYYLPSLLGRGKTVREDFSELARTLPGDEDEIPEDLYAGMVKFVLDNGSPSSQQAAELKASIQ